MFIFSDKIKKPSLKIALPSLKVLSPNGGENWIKGIEHKITWKAVSIKGTLKITLWKKGVKLGVIKSKQDPAPGFIDWEVGKYAGGKAPPGSRYKIKIKETGKPLNDFSDKPFTILRKLEVGFTPALIKINITYPKKTSNWKEGETETIKWETLIKPPFKVELFNYNGKKKVRDCQGLVKSHGGNKYSMTWNIPTDVFKWPGNYTMRVSKGSLSDLSDMFHISKAIQIKTYTFMATTVNKVRWHSYKPDKDVFTSSVPPKAGDPGPGKMRIGYENYDTPDIYKGYIYRSWVFFNLGSLKGFVSKATLSYNHFMGCNFNPGVYILDQKWSGDAGALFSIPCSQINPSSNIATYVNGWLSQGNNYGFVFVGLDESFQHNNNHCYGFFENVKLTIEIIEDI